MSWQRRKFVKNTSLLAGGLSCGLLSLNSCTAVKYVTPTITDKALVVDKSHWGEADFVLVRTPGLPAPIYLKQKGSEYTALLLECTHKQCEVRPTSKLLKCPCHGSEFDYEGKVLDGPATENLRSFNTRDDEKSIYIQ